MKISDILWRAANEHLWDGSSIQEIGQWAFSCDAAFEAASINPTTLKDMYSYRESAVGEFLEELGCPVTTAISFFDFPEGPQRQGARYLWLMFAYLVAKDEGL